MWYLYLDESGDLGFDFVNKKPSRFFTIAILLVQGAMNNEKLNGAIQKVIRRRLFKKRKMEELKGSSTDPKVKEYFYRTLLHIEFKIFAISLDKRMALLRLMRQKGRIYNYMASLLLKKVGLKDANTAIELSVDKSKRKAEIQEFNGYLFQELRGTIKPTTRFDIRHIDSRQSKGLQAADMFCWGFFQKYERKNPKWIKIFKEKIAYDEKYQ